MKDPITEAEVKIDPSVPVVVKKDMLELLNEYNRGAFAKNIQELGCTTVMQMDIAEMPSSVPINQKPYRMSPSYRATVSNILTKWKNAGIISYSCSLYASPVLLVDKANGDKRLCVDYRIQIPLKSVRTIRDYLDVKLITSLSS